MRHKKGGAAMTRTEMQTIIIELTKAKDGIEKSKTDLSQKLIYKIAIIKKMIGYCQKSLDWSVGREISKSATCQADLLKVQLLAHKVNDKRIQKIVSAIKCF